MSIHPMELKKESTTYGTQHLRIWLVSFMENIVFGLHLNQIHCVSVSKSTKFGTGMKIVESRSNRMYLFTKSTKLVCS